MGQLAVGCTSAEMFHPYSNVSSFSPGSVAGPSVTCGVTLPAHPSRSHSALGIRRLVCPNTNSWMGTHLIAGPAGVHNPTPVNSHGFPQDTS